MGGARNATAGEWCRSLVSRNVRVPARQYAVECRVFPPFTVKNKMLTTLAFILLVLWLLGLVSSYTVGGFIHILLVAAIIMFLVRVVQGRRPVV